APLDDPFPPGQHGEVPPAPPYGTHLNVFQGTDPNGLWSLYVVDDALGDVGFIGDGWTLDISIIDPQADIGLIVQDIPHDVIIGSNLTYTITVTNNGPGWATGIRLHDVLPTNIDLLSVTNSSGNCSNSGGTIDCAWTQLDPG